MAQEKLGEYRRKRDARRTPEPVPDAAPDQPDQPDGAGRGDRFVVQEHHATALHWDLRLERDGVLVSWALPKGVPPDPKVNHLAVHTEDHPMEYAAFSGDIPRGEYGGGSMSIWDSGTYETQTWTDREVKFVLHGQRAQGRFTLFKTDKGPDGRNWMIHRMDAPAKPDWVALPKLVQPMTAVLSELPDDDDRWAYELKWDGERAVVYVDGGRARALSRNEIDITVSYPELRLLGEAIGTTQVVLDGELVAFDDQGRPSFRRLQERMHVRKAADVRRVAPLVPVTYLVFDLLHLDGRSTLALPYTERRALLEELRLAGPHWQTTPSFTGGGTDVLEASRQHGFEGVMAKRLASPYRPGKRSPDWRKVKNVRTQEVVIAGWRPGQGRFTGELGALVLGLHTGDGFVYCGGVGTGFTAAMRADLQAKLEKLARKTPPYDVDVPRERLRELRDVHWVTPRYVGEVAFAEWTDDGRMRHPTWRGLRPDKSPGDVVRES